MRNHGPSASILRAAVSAVADFFFPRACLGCSMPGVWLCDRCLRSIRYRTDQECHVCRKSVTPSGEPCFACRRKTELDGIFVATPFADPIVSKSIHVLKYEFVEELARPLGTILGASASGCGFPLPDVLVPVPLHPWRYRWRGFNQSALIANHASSEIAPGIGVPVDEKLLVRRRFTLPQAKTSGAAERRKNLSGAFAVRPDRSECRVRGSTIWLVDDVATTGSTLEECARALKRSGADRVYAVVVAR